LPTYSYSSPGLQAGIKVAVGIAEESLVLYGRLVTVVVLNIGATRDEFAAATVEYVELENGVAEL